MLVLTRKIGETLKIGDDIEVQILDINRGQVRIGIAAPRDINIVRSELIGRPRQAEAAVEHSTKDNNNLPRDTIRRHPY